MSLLEFGWFSTHSKFLLPWKIDCDALKDSDIEAIAQIIRWKFAFSDVYGVPRGGVRLQHALLPYCEVGYPTLIVDDVLTTGNSMEEARRRLEDGLITGYGPLTGRPIGVVIFSRGHYNNNWIWPILSVNEWAQSRATGLG